MTYRLPKPIRRNGGTVALCGVAGLILAFNAPNVARNMQASGQARQALAAANLETEQITAAEDLRKKRASIADDRFKSCNLVFSRGTATMAAIQEGKPVLDSTGAPLAQGVVVCDYAGNTAVIANDANGNPVATDLAATQNRDAINAIIARYQGAEFKAPKIGGGE